MRSGEHIVPSDHDAAGVRAGDLPPGIGIEQGHSSSGLLVDIGDRDVDDRLVGIGSPIENLVGHRPNILRHAEPAGPTGDRRTASRAPWSGGPEPAIRGSLAWGSLPCL